MRLRALGLMVVVALVGLMAGCRGAAKPAASATKQFPVRGVVTGVNQSAGSIDLNHEAIPGLMEAMEMSYRLEDKSVASELHSGDKITATLECEMDSAGPLNMRLKDVVVIAQARPDYVPKVQYHVPAVGDVVPKFALLNQSGKTIDTQGFKGKVVVMTFVYTRCQLAEFCPRMSRNFAEIDKALAADPALYPKTHLLSVSFDPTYDTPKVLKSYGAAYTGRYTKETFDHWDFAAPTVAELPRVEEWFDLGVTPGADAASLMHSLSTLVIGRDGKVAAFYGTNDWSVPGVMEVIRKAS